MSTRSMPKKSGCRPRTLYEQFASLETTEQAVMRPFYLQICKYFIDAVEKSKYGWFWECPNGEKCIYRHALPPGYVLKKDKKKEEKREEISLVDLIERERAALGSDLVRAFFRYIPVANYPQLSLPDKSNTGNLPCLEKTENSRKER